jgi:predicted enzyme related to lactoylglutathione lyase
MARVMGVILRSQKPSEMVAFYEKLLGVHSSVRSHGLRYAHVDICSFGADAIFAIDNANPPLEEPVIMLEVENLEKSREVVVTYGGTFEREVAGRLMYVRDPEGRSVLLVAKEDP